MASNPRILLLTGLAKENLLQSLLEKNYAVTVVVPESEKYRRQYAGVVALAEARGAEVVRVIPSRIESETAHLSYDLLLSSGYPFLIPKSVCDRAKLAVNVHPTLLPRHRGRYLHWVLMEKDKESGVTAHVIDEGYDTGPIIAQKKFLVSPFDTVKSLMRKSKALELDLVSEVIELFIADKVRAIPQDESKATSHFEKRTLKDSEIDPKKSLEELFYTIRAMDPDDYPAFFHIDGEKVYLRLYRKEKPESEKDMI